MHRDENLTYTVMHYPYAFSLTYYSDVSGLSVYKCYIITGHQFTCTVASKDGLMGYILYGYIIGLPLQNRYTISLQLSHQ